MRPSLQVSARHIGYDPNAAAGESRKLETGRRGMPYAVKERRWRNDLYVTNDLPRADSPYVALEVEFNLINPLKQEAETLNLPSTPGTGK